MAPITLSIREATPKDAPAIVALVRSAYRGESSRSGWTTEADLVDDERIDVVGVLKKIDEPLGIILLIQDQSGTLIACCELLRRDDVLGYFGLFAVDPTRQAGGIGRFVLSEAETYAKKVWGLNQLEMTVIWTREELIAWYIRRGYIKLEETRPFPYTQLMGAATPDRIQDTSKIRSTA
ncbi:hypothetical protein PT974_03162 [Cladobotryum mycophilum]|uniref:N-acetyltransferase domain-containing protein n=1 Tax=Cladobotryum mycophilum TaxID=491253 RepID=A0ABR0SRI0_9HYPO